MFTQKNDGTWQYLECPGTNTINQHLYLPASSTHTLHALADMEGPTGVFSEIYGANLNLDDDGNVEAVTDAGSALGTCLEECGKADKPSLKIIGT